MHHILGHRSVDLTRQLDEPGILAVFPRLPGQIKWVDGNAVSPQSGPRIKGHETKGLGLGRFNHLPDVDPHRAVYHLQLVDQGYVHTAKDVLHELGRLRGPARRHRHDRFDGPAIQRAGTLQAGRSQTAHHLGDVRHPALRIARVLTLRRECQMKLFARLQARAGLQHLTQVRIRGTRIRRRLQYHQAATLQIRGNRPTRVQDKRNVRLPILAQRCRHTNDHRLHLPHLGKIRTGGKTTGRNLLGHGLCRNVMNVAASAVQRLHLHRIDV